MRAGFKRGSVNRKAVIIFGLIWLLLAIGCARSVNSAAPWRPAPQDGVQATQAPASELANSPTKRAPYEPGLTPTPDPPRQLPTARSEVEQYTVQRSDTLGNIARRYGVSLDQLVKANNIDNPDQLSVGQQLTIPPPETRDPGPSFKIVPDSELVNSPSAADFDLAGFIQKKNGYLSQYSETLDNRSFSGTEVIDRISKEYSVNPRLLLAILEYRSGWVTQSNPPEKSKDYALQYIDQRRPGLYRQLAWAADNLNHGYYLWKINALASWVLQDGNSIPINPTINAGTAGVQYFFAAFLNLEDWQAGVSAKGLFATYNKLFGNPFNYTFEPVVPADLKQPHMQLPFERGVSWSFTGGPHGGWGDGSGWAAIDFGPPGETYNCSPNDTWETAVADGLIIRSDLGSVVEDLDGDGIEQTGWTVLYLHVGSQDRVAAGTRVHAGDRIGHPSCEGGITNGTHLHLARRYNGEWIPADGSIPFNLDGWVTKGDGVEYNGFLVKKDQSIEAWDGRRPENQINR